MNLTQNLITGVKTFMSLFSGGINGERPQRFFVTDGDLQYQYINLMNSCSYEANRLYMLADRHGENSQEALKQAKILEQTQSKLDHFVKINDIKY